VHYFLDVADAVAYFTLRLQSIRALSVIQSSGSMDVPGHILQELKLAYTRSSFVVLIFFIPSSQSFEGYSLVEGFESGANPNKFSITFQVSLVRRAQILFNQVSHIRDDFGLGGRPVSAARDGSKLGVPAGRVLCRSIDKRAYNNDPVHYKDKVYMPRIITETVFPNPLRPSNSETEFLKMDYEEYLQAFSRRRDEGEPVPSIDNIVHF
jgi:hypothetical protein